MIFPDPILQLGFATLLDNARQTILASALLETVGQISTKELDRQLAGYVSDEALALLAARGIRGETIFPVPLVLQAKPSLIGYYRLVYGYSQKQFYTAQTGASSLKAMENRNKLSGRATSLLPEICRAFANSGEVLLRGLGSKLAVPGLLHELSLLTLGAQFRGGANNARGSAGINAVFAVLKDIFGDKIEDTGERKIVVRNAAGRMVTIKIAADPDILITSVMSDGNIRPIVAMEIKAGEDHSNIWNRIGEAEKSHQKARLANVTECWTIINDPKADHRKLKEASPSTDRFYQMVELANDESEQHRDFSSRVRDMVGV